MYFVFLFLIFPFAPWLIYLFQMAIRAAWAYSFREQKGQYSAFMFHSRLLNLMVEIVDKTQKFVFLLKIQNPKTQNFELENWKSVRACFSK